MGLTAFHKFEDTKAAMEAAGCGNGCLGTRFCQRVNEETKKMKVKRVNTYIWVVHFRNELLSPHFFTKDPGLDVVCFFTPRTGMIRIISGCNAGCSFPTWAGAMEVARGLLRWL